MNYAALEYVMIVLRSCNRLEQVNSTLEWFNNIAEYQGFGSDELVLVVDYSFAVMRNITGMEKYDA